MAEHDARDQARALPVPPAETRPAPAEAGLKAARLEYRLVRHAKTSSLAEAAAVRGIDPGDIVKTLVVRRGVDDFLFVLVPGDREIAWPKLRAHLGVNRLSMPSAAQAFEVTGYQRGSITPFGAKLALPVVADATIKDRVISLGAGEPGAAVLVDAGAALRALDATAADITSRPG